MSSKKDKKARKVLRSKIQVEGKAVVLSHQSLIIAFAFRKRASIAWKILRGKPFLGGAGLVEEKE